MIFPCKFNSSNGYNVAFVPSVRKESIDRGILGTLSLSMLGSEAKDFIFARKDRLKTFYTCLMGMYMSIYKESTTARTIELPSIKLDEYIGVVTNDREKCIITLKTKHITKKDDTFKTVDVLEMDRDNLHLLLTVMGRTLYDDELLEG